MGDRLLTVLSSAFLKKIVMKIVKVASIVLAFLLILACGCNKNLSETKDSIVKRIHVSKTELTLRPGESETVKASVVPSVAVQPTMAWSTSDESVATVSAGKISAVAVGEAVITVSCQGKSSDIKVTVVPSEGEALYTITLKGEDCPFADYAEYGIYLPPKWEKLRGILILQHGCGMEQFGITRNKDLQYQAFAKKWGLLVIETALHGDCGVWHHPENGSAAAIFKVIAEVASEQHHPELASLPLLIFGHSSGGHWTLAMLRDYPEKILAAVTYSAAWDPQWDYMSVAAGVPLLLRHAGQNDAPTCLCEATAVHTFAKMRKMDGYTAIAYNPGQNHNLAYIRHMSIPFFEAALKQRLPEAGSTKMRSVDASGCWLGNPDTFELIKESEYKGSDKASWCRLLDKEIAEKWKEYVMTNDIVDTTAPDAPYDIVADKTAENMYQVSWKADADIESGISKFRIFLDGEQIGMIPETGNYQNFDTNGDNTYPVDPPAMTFTVNVGPGKHTIAVETVNQSGLASPKAEISVK